jgi:hypothetical protein
MKVTGVKTYVIENEPGIRMGSTSFGNDQDNLQAKI